MPEFFFTYRIGGDATVKVTAEDRDTALERLQTFAIDDWENAGPLRHGDVVILESWENGGAPVGGELMASIRDEAGAWGYAPDDERYDPELYDEEVAR